MDKVIIIAEAGVNHNGSFAIAKEMVDKAVEAGADYIKFQTFVPEKLASRYSEKAAYQKVTTGNDEGQLDMLRKLTLEKEEYIALADYCKEKQIGFMSTPFETESSAFLQQIGMDYWKIPSGEITNYPYLVDIASKKGPIILSTGMSNEDEVGAALKVLKENGAGEIILLHCTTEYPTPYEDVNLRAMNSLKDRFGLEVGYSDHTKGIEVPVAAVALGAKVIEKHFTLDRTMEGPDHKASLEPDELKTMVDQIRHIERALGDGVKKPADSEIKNIAIARKSIVANCKINKGDKLTEENLTTKRPGNGISPMRWNEVLGSLAIRDFDEDELIEL